VETACPILCRRLLAGFFVAALLTKLVPACRAEQDAASVSRGSPQQVAGRITYESLREQLELRLQAGQRRVNNTAASRAIVPARELFEGWMYHARLTGEPESYLRAREVLAELCFRSRVTPPCREQAQFGLATHQIAAAVEALRHCPPEPLSGTLVDLAYYQGNYAAALEQAVAAANADRHLPDPLSRLAKLRMSTGSPAEADALLETAERRYHNGGIYQRAWYKLQRGLVALQRGDYPRARMLFQRALEVMPGWWLAKEHLAEVSLLLGDHVTAARLYDEVIADTASGEYMAARAAIDRLDGDDETAEQRMVLARADMDRRLELMPEAFAGHAVNFYLLDGQNEKALALAREDYLRRPFGDSATALARALLHNRQPDAAIAVLNPHLEKSWSTAEAHQVMAQAYREIGEQDASERHRQLALALNPSIGER